jgi:hypothetical protein
VSKARSDQSSPQKMSWDKFFESLGFDQKDITLSLQDMISGPSSPERPESVDGNNKHNVAHYHYHHHR